MAKPIRKKKIEKVIKLQISAGKATPAPPIGPALGQHGVSIMDFCKKYNEMTKDKGNIVVPVEITIYGDKSFSIKLKTPPVSMLIKNALNLTRGSDRPNTKIVGTLSKDQLSKIVDIKIQDLNAVSQDAAKRIIKGSARSMGVKVTL